MDLGAPYHLGVAVHDLDASMGRYHSLLGIDRWAVQFAEIETEYKGRPSHQTQRYAYAPWGASYLELVQPLSGDGPASDFLREHGEGAYHVGYFHDALDEVSAGDIPIIRRVWNGDDLRALYLDTLEDLGLYVELVGRSREDFMQWIAGAARVREPGA